MRVGLGLDTFRIAVALSDAAGSLVLTAPDRVVRRRAKRRQRPHRRAVGEQCAEEPCRATNPPGQIALGTATARQIALGGLVRFICRPWRMLTTVAPAAIHMAFRTLRLATESRTTRQSMRVPRTIFTGNVSELRSVAYSQLDLSDVQTVRDGFGRTVNDVVLAVVSGALRRLLIEHDALPTSTLIAAMPVLVQSNRDSRNNLSGTRCPLHTDIADPVDRLRLSWQRDWLRSLVIQRFRPR